MDYPPEPTDDYLELCLKKGDIVQVLDQHSGGRWFVRASMGAGAFAHGWFPSEHLQCLSENEAVDETDSKDSWVQITAGECFTPGGYCGLVTYAVCVHMCICMRACV